MCVNREKEHDTLVKCCNSDKAFEISESIFCFYQEFDDNRLKIDDEYYKRELLQPVGIITQNLTNFSTDRYLRKSNFQTREGRNSRSRWRPRGRKVRPCSKVQSPTQQSRNQRFSLRGWGRFPAFAVSRCRQPMKAN